MLRKIKKEKPKTGLEIGCGTGAFCRRLADKCQTVIGIDVALGMIDAAKRRNSGENITYLLADVNTFLSDKENCFDVITSIAAFHHMDGERTLAHFKDDHYQTIAQLRAQAKGVLENVDLKRHIFWSYTLFYIKHVAGHDRLDSQ